MLRDDETPAAPPCCICGQPSECAVWGTPICHGCHGAWVREMPPLGELELKHADAHPEDVEQRGEYQFRDPMRKDNRWVLLKPGVTERVARAAATAWLKQQLAKAKARAA